jgi:hypothetical protein
MRYATQLLCITALLTTGAAALAQPPTIATMGLRDLYADVQALMRIAPLQLTDAQLDQLIALYAELDAEQARAAYNEQTLDQLQTMRDRLLADQPLRAEDEVVLRGIYKVAGIVRSERYDLEKLTPRLLQIIGPDQLDRLADLSSRSAAYALAVQRGIVTRALTRLTEAIPKPLDKWLEARGRCVETLVEEIADPEQKQAARDKLVPFLEELRKLPLQDLRQRGEQLAYQVIQLVPQIGQASIARGAGRRQDNGAAAEEDRQRRRARSLYVFAGRNVPALLQEMKAARSAQPASQPPAVGAQAPEANG